ncbi:MAG: DNA mismatch repair protein MutS [Dehalococcoidales bacterium]|nr:DNA mismatch repair protein MutS [Dehalococcoidales bacterium]
MAENNLTPVRQQYLSIKKKYPEAIVLFRLGDFYETFDEDAAIASKELEIVLTSREMGKGCKVPLAGIPYHALDNYLARLINRGYKVAICEQVTKPGETKGLVQREVVRLVTPGTVVEPSLLDSKTNNYLTSLVLGAGEVGIAYVDITTSEFATTQLPFPRLIPELKRLNPSEVITAESSDLSELDLTAPVTSLEDYWFELEVAQKTLLDHFNAVTLDGYGCANLPLAVRAAGAILHYINETQKGVLGQLTRLATYSTESFMALDEQTQSNLELFRNSRSGTAEGSFLSIIDLTETAMGGRLLKRWLGQPLLDIAELVKRQDAVSWFYKDTIARKRVTELLGDVADLERLINRVKGGTAIPRELVTLRRSLEVIPEMRGLLGPHEGDSPVKWLKDLLKPCSEVADLIAEAIEEQPSSSLGEGGVIKQGFSEELDSLCLADKSTRQYLANLERKERERTGIQSLKVGFNQVFGYYIEVSKPNLSQVPSEYVRKQTLVNGERFFTTELKEYESLIFNTRERIEELETNLFNRVCRQIGTATERVLATANALANVDVFSSLAEVAMRHSYTRPELTTDKAIVINQGRHPVVERSLVDSSFVPNDIHLDNDDAQIMVLTGPNMSGKSTYLRQVAMIVLLAQMGSFVPADSAKIGLVDRIFTRIGAREDLAAGQSTFMAEMVETANILNNATPQSLIILDEIGRGTSTYDGLSIARAVTEYIHNHAGLGTKTVFATHYHEMVELASFLPRVKNFNVAVTEEKGKVIFLYKVVPGGVDKSYGIHVAQLAGLPKAVINRAGEVLAELEGGSRAVVTEPPPPKPSPRRRRQKIVVQQMTFFGPKPPAVEELEKLDIDALTPLEALTRLYELQKKAREG